ncbi:hypothetical protein BDN67DRAFT_975103 [Paxillus ammoniavirescens]|nr:hypothetical protein BDN67DRAFT_975103 [Paxillus ammoniavirescens]
MCVEGCQGVFGTQVVGKPAPMLVSWLSDYSADVDDLPNCGQLSDGPLVLMPKQFRMEACLVIVLIHLTHYSDDVDIIDTCSAGEHVFPRLKSPPHLAAQARRRTYVSTHAVIVSQRTGISSGCSARHAGLQKPKRLVKWMTINVNAYWRRFPSGPQKHRSLEACADDRKDS